MAAESNQTVEVEEGQILFRQDEPAAHLYVIESGRLRLERRAFQDTFVLEELGPGAVLGEMALVDGGRHPTTAIAEVKSRVHILERTGLQARMAAEPRLFELVLKKLGARLSHAHARLSVFSLRRAEGRIMLQLRQEMQRSGAPGESAFLPLPWDLPMVLCMERGLLLQVMDQLAAQALVELDGNGNFRIPDIRAWDRRLAYLELRDRFEP